MIEFFFLLSSLFHILKYVEEGYDTQKKKKKIFKYRIMKIGCQSNPILYRFSLHVFFCCC